MFVKCPGVDFVDGESVKCETNARCRVWCPTWTTAQDGPVSYCEKHIGTFKEEENPNAADGQFFFDDDAYDAWKSVQSFFKVNDVRIEGTLKKFPVRKAGGPNHSIIFIDGHAWMRTYALGLPGEGLIMNLGDHFAARARFPKLFKGI